MKNVNCRSWGSRPPIQLLSGAFLKCHEKDALPPLIYRGLQLGKIYIFSFWFTVAVLCHNIQQITSKKPSVPKIQVHLDFVPLYRKKNCHKIQGKTIFREGYSIQVKTKSRYYYSSVHQQVLYLMRQTKVIFANFPSKSWQLMEVAQKWRKSIFCALIVLWP